MVPRPALACAARARNLLLVRGSIAACLMASLTGCAQILGIDELSPGQDAGVDAGTSLTAPAPRTPMNGSRVGSLAQPGSRRPAFTWEEMEGATYVLEYGTDPTFTTGVTRVETDGGFYKPDGDLVVSDAPPVGARYYWRVSACKGGRCSEPGRAWYLDVARLRPDVNRDGYDDILVGAPADPQGALLGGAAYAYTGGPGSSFDMLSDGQIVSSTESEQLGESVALGDLDGDGFAEMIVGAPLFSNQDGIIHINYGSPEAPSIIPGVTTMLGDVPGIGFGASLTTGDFNGDGFGDLIIGDIGIDDIADGTGRVSIYLGVSGGFDTDADASFRGFRSRDGFGSIVASAGDINGDGYEDFMVGIPEQVQVAVYFGGPSDTLGQQVPVTLFELPAAGFGSAMTGADVDGDGYSDVIVGAPGAGAVLVYRGGPGELDTTADFTITGVGQPGFGRAVSSGGDMNGDSLPELVITFSGGETTCAATVYAGNPEPATGLNSTIGVEGTVDSCAVSEPADFNGDGVSDVVVSGGPNASVQVLLGGSLILPNVTALPSNTTNIGFGAAIAP